MIKWLLKSRFRKKKRARGLDDGRFPARNAASATFPAVA
jgi:hypothetical protein